MWRYVFTGQAGTHAIDYRAALFELNDLGLQGRVRSAFRELHSRRSELDALIAETSDLLALMGESAE
jgi:hypothetical protein